MIPVLWLCGPPGVGKTAVAWEVYARLLRAGSTPAYVDADQVGMCYLRPASDPARHELKARNIGALRANFSAAGARCLVVSGVVDANRGPEIDLVGGGDITVCRLRAAPAELITRVAGRSGSSALPGAAIREAAVLDRSTFTEWCLDTTGLTVNEVARRVCAQISDWPRVTSNTGGRQPRLTGRATGKPGRGDLLWLCGPSGVGKSTVGFNAYLKVLRSGVPAAYVDVDQLSFCATERTDHRLRADNLAALWESFHSTGAQALVVVGPIATRSEAIVYEQALPTASFTWCRLHASRGELTRRILSRGDGGSWPQPGDPLRDRPTKDLLQVANRAVDNAQILEQQGLGLRIEVDDLGIGEAADTVLTRAAWPPQPGT